MTSKQDLLRRIVALQERIHSLFEESTVASHNLPEARLQSSWTPCVDVYETEREFVLTAEIPGLEQDEVDLQIANHTLYLRGERRPSVELPQQIYHCLELPSGRFERRFTLPEEINQDEIKAHMTGGVLTVFLPKKVGRPQTIKVEVNKNKSGSRKGF